MVFVILNYFSNQQDGSIKVDRKNNDVVLNREAEGLSNAGETSLS